MIYGLPESVEVGSREYAIRSDFRAILDICIALEDVNLSDEDKALAALVIFYPDFETIPAEDYPEALKQCYWFIDGGDTEEQTDKKSPRLVDWEQDYKLIVAPVNRVIGSEIRAAKHLHWWTFLSAYYEIGGDCTFAQVVAIRDKRARGKTLDKQEREWYRRNRSMVDIKRRYSSAEDELLKQWI